MDVEQDAAYRIVFEKRVELATDLFGRRAAAGVLQHVDAEGQRAHDGQDGHCTLHADVLLLGLPIGPRGGDRRGVHVDPQGAGGDHAANGLQLLGADQVGLVVDAA